MAAAPPPPPTPTSSNSQYPFYIRPKIIINFDLVQYDKSGRENEQGGSLEIVEYNLLHLISHSFPPFPPPHSLSISVPLSSIIIFHATFAQIQNMRWCDGDCLWCKMETVPEANRMRETTREIDFERKKLRDNLWITSLERIQCGQLPKNTHTHIENHFDRYVSLSTTITDIERTSKQATKINLRRSFRSHCWRYCCCWRCVCVSVCGAYTRMHIIGLRSCISRLV